MSGLKEQNPEFVIRFINALDKVNETLESFITNYIRIRENELKAKDIAIPKHSDKCICGQPIKINCYAIDEFHNNKILILGKCCIKKSMDKNAQSKHCINCRKPHKNRKYDLCGDCVKQEKERLKEKMKEKEIKRDLKRRKKHRMMKIIMKFGKYKNMTVYGIYKKDKSYLKYIKDNDYVKSDISPALYEAVNYFIERANKKSKST